MSSWIKSYQSLREHPKTRKLARRNGIGGIRGAIGLLHCLWWWAADYAPDGDLTKHDTEDVAVACEWDGEPAEIIKHLVDCGFLENNDGLHIHDWSDYAGALIERRDRNAERMRQTRAANVQSTCDARAGLDREIEREKKRAPARGPVDNSTVRPSQRATEGDRTCWRCGEIITGDDVLDDRCVLSSRGIRHKECEVAP